MKKVILPIVLMLASLSAFSQVQLGVRGGGSFYFGDLTSDNDKSIHNSRETFGFYLRHDLKPYLSVQLGYNWVNVFGTDAHAGYSRSLQVSTFINEFTLMPEFNFLRFNIGETGKFSTYVGAGVSFVNYMPTTHYKSSTYVRLRELGTEGQGLEGSNTDFYSKNTFAIPMTFGLRFAFNDFFSLDWCILNNRYTFTDYLDDVSTTYPDADKLRSERGQIAVDLAFRGGEVPAGTPRGTADTNDWFGSMTLGFCFNIGAIAKKKDKK